jgi:hypothetical protein
MLSYHPLSCLLIFNHICSYFLPLHFILASYYAPNTYLCINIPKLLVQNYVLPNLCSFTPQCVILIFLFATYGAHPLPIISLNLFSLQTRIFHRTILLLAFLVHYSYMLPPFSCSLKYYATLVNLLSQHNFPILPLCINTSFTDFHPNALIILPSILTNIPHANPSSSYLIPFIQLFLPSFLCWSSASPNGFVSSISQSTSIFHYTL